MLSISTNTGAVRFASPLGSRRGRSIPHPLFRPQWPLPFHSTAAVGRPLGIWIPRGQAPDQSVVRDELMETVAVHHLLCMFGSGRVGSWSGRKAERVSVQSRHSGKVPDSDKMKDSLSA